MSTEPSKTGKRVSTAAIGLIAALQYFNAATSFWRGDWLSGSVGCALGAILLLMQIGTPQHEEREPAEAFRYGWRHHKGLIALGLLPLAVGLWIGFSLGGHGWLQGGFLALIGVPAVLALLIQRYWRRHREAEGRPKEF